MPGITEKQAQSIAKTLQETFLFRGVMANEIVPLLQMPGIDFVRYAAGEEMLSAQTGGGCLGVLLRGSAVVEKHSQQGYLRMSVLQPRALFGMAAIFTDGVTREYPTRILAQKNAAALLIPEPVFREMLRSDFRLCENYMRYLTGRIHFLNERIEELICPTTEQRVLLYISQNAGDGKLTLALTALAQSLSVSRASLYRALDKLEAENKIRRKGRTIEIVEVSPDIR